MTTEIENLSTWNTPALIREARDTGSEHYRRALTACVSRLQELVGMNEEHGPISGRCFVVVGPGYWGRGKTLTDAALACRTTGAWRSDRACAYLILNDATPEMNGGGMLITDAKASAFYLGAIGTLGSILTANKL